MLATSLHAPVRPPFLVRHAPQPVSHLPKSATACSTCALRSLCMPGDMRGEDAADIDGMVTSRRRVKRGEHVYRAGDPFVALYAVRTGFFKSYVESEDGRTQITSFQMPGEISGLDGIETDHHTVNLVALEDGDICVITYSQLESISARVSGFMRHIHRVMSREIVREQTQMMLLGTMRAEARVAAFILSLAERFAARGYSASEFNLRMTREEIGSFLGLKLETISRIFSRFQEAGLVQVQGRAIKLIDHASLREMAGQTA
jgi:CRP/FNR family transcriptional regulator